MSGESLQTFAGGGGVEGHQAAAARAVSLAIARWMEGVTDQANRRRTGARVRDQLGIRGLYAEMVDGPKKILELRL